MTLNVPVGDIAAYLIEHPWPVAGFVFLLGVVLPAVWWDRRSAAVMAVLRAVLDAATRIAALLRGTHQ